MEFNYKPFSKVMEGNHLALIGHNRAATRGKVSKSNAHPFQHGKITGVHNGTLTNCLDLPDHAMFDVDSDNIFYSIDKIGVKETLEKLKGAFALVWWNSEDNTLHFARNDERPFHFMYSEDRKRIFWASESEMLKFILGRKNIKTHEHDKGGSVYFTRPFKHYSMKIEPGKELQLVEVEEFKEAPKSTFHSGGSSKAPWKANNHNKKTVGNPRIPVLSSKKESNVVPLRNFYKAIKAHKTTYLGFQKKVVSATTLSNLLKVGCSCCEKVTEFDGTKTEIEVHFFDEHSHICGDCHGEISESKRWNEYVN